MTGKIGEQKDAVNSKDGPDVVEQELAEKLRVAAWIFEREPNGRFQGSIVACRAVIEFISRRGGGAELAGPFHEIANAFEELERGGKPRLFSKKGTPAKERERSPERRRIHFLAAAALGVLLELGEELEPAATKVARHVNQWRGMKSQDVRSSTVIAWRKDIRRNKKVELNRLIDQAMKTAEPRTEIERLLKDGPPGLFE